MWTTTYTTVDTERQKENHILNFKSKLYIFYI